MAHILIRSQRCLDLKLARYVLNGEIHVGIVKGNDVFDIQKSAKTMGLKGLAEISNVDQLLANGLGELRSAVADIFGLDYKVPLRSVKLLSPITAPEKILCAAVNYKSQGAEQDVKPPSEPYFFSKFRNGLIGDGDPIVVPKISQKVDWEVELSVVIGRPGKYIPKKQAMEYVAGYAVSNDVSFRDLQFPPSWSGSSPFGQNFVKGKCLDAAFPFGPWLVTKDEIEDPSDLELSLTVNGKVKQKSSTADMVFEIDYLIEYLSAGMTLKPGDIISTGTPFGVALFSGEPYLKDGDIVEASITGIGTLRNPVTAEVQ